jgi:hypothetical protein
LSTRFPGAPRYDDGASVGDETERAMADEKDPYEQQQEALEDVDEDEETADPETDLEGEDVRPGGDSTPQRRPRA